MIDTPGIYPDIPMADYVRDPCPEPSASGSTLATILNRTPLHAWYAHPRLNPIWAEKHETVFDIGSVAHAMYLEGDESAVEVVTGFGDWRTKAARELRDAVRSAGKIPLLIHQYEQCKRIADASERLHPINRAASKMEQTCANLFNDFWYRCRPDAFDERVIISYKTTSNANPDSFGRVALSLGYHVQAYGEIATLEALTGSHRGYLWIVQEIDPPYAVSVVQCDGAMLALAKAEWELAFGIWCGCLSTRKWNGYPTTPVRYDPPAWRMEQCGMRAGMDDDVVDDMIGAL